MAKRIDIRPEQLRGTATQMDNVAGEYGAAFALLYQHVNRMQSEWQGADNLAYTAQIEGFRPHLENLRKLMNDYAEFLRTSANLFDQTQGEIRTRAGTLVK